MDPLIPPITSAQMPAEVRATGAEGEQLYRAALAFESQLVQQMTQALAQTARDGSSSDGSDTGDPSSGAIGSTGSDPATAMYMNMLPDQLTQGLMGAGGTGLAESMWRSMWRAQGGTLPTPSQVAGVQRMQGGGS
jgi:Rod binding domain-containing protein